MSGALNKSLWRRYEMGRICPRDGKEAAQGKSQSLSEGFARPRQSRPGTKRLEKAPGYANQREDCIAFRIIFNSPLTDLLEASKTAPRVGERTIPTDQRKEPQVHPPTRQISMENIIQQYKLMNLLKGACRSQTLEATMAQVAISSKEDYNALVDKN
jgi:hypothetical protein